MQKSLLALSILGAANIAVAAQNQDKCSPEPPATCYPENCNYCYCLGPENYGVNAPVRPNTCNGDWVISVAGFYWNAHQDGMEYAVDNRVKTDLFSEETYFELNNLIDAEYKTPHFQWDFGFKVGLGYNTTCDGWDFGVVWTWYRGKANDHIEAEIDDNHTLLTLWSVDFIENNNILLFASDIETHWKLELNLIDIELGREYWTSKYLSFRPFVGLRIAYLEQNFTIQHKGGFWNEFPAVPVNNKVDLDNDFKGVGARAGFNTNWNFGCGFSLYGNLAASIIYGRFSVDHDEENREAESPFNKIKVLETEESLRASRGILDLALGIEWSSLFCDCQYGFTVQLGWEQHLFFHQNQLWRVYHTGRLGDVGENTFFQRRGTLDTQGWTLKVQFEF